MDRPGVGVTLRFLGQQVTIGGGHVHTDEDGPLRLKQFVVGSDVDGRQILAGVEGTGGRDGVLDDVVDGAQRQGVVEVVAEQFLNAAEGTVAGQHQAEDETTQPGARHGQGEKELVVVRCGRRKGVLQGVTGVLDLPGDKLATDVMLLGELGDGGTSQGVEGQLLA